MPPGKKAGRKKSAGKRANAGRGSSAGGGGKPKCGEKDICAYLNAWTKYFETEFIPHYDTIVNAICNLEKVAIRKLGNNQALQICPGVGGGAEPPPPPPPPKW